MPPAPICEELHMAVERAANRSAVSIDALRLAVRRFTIALRDDGAPPEAILIALKTVINTRTFEVMPTIAGDWGVDDLRHLVSTWSIEEFFSERQA